MMNQKYVEKIVDERVNKISKTKSNNAKKKRELIKKIKDDNLEYYVTGGLGFILKVLFSNLILPLNNRDIDFIINIERIQQTTKGMLLNI